MLASVFSYLGIRAKELTSIYNFRHLEEGGFLDAIR